MNNILFNLSDVYNEEKISIPFHESEETIVGGIILNRIVGIANNNLNLSTLNRESRKCLSCLKGCHEKQFDSFIRKLEYISQILSEADFKYALLKGAFLTPMFYKRGQRTSNDIDILVDANDTTKIQYLLTQNGFVQGHCDDKGNIILATRREIVESKLNYGETVPFILPFNNEILEIDINFSVDFQSKDKDGIVKKLLDKSLKKKTDYVEVTTLSEEDFLIHLCCHLYKEATTWDWVVNRRDLMLYKFSDINVFLHKYANDIFFSRLINRIKTFHVEKACYYAFTNAMIIYPRLSELCGFLKNLDAIKPLSTDFMKQVVYPKNKRIYFYDVDFETWFNTPDRTQLLHEIA